MDDNEYVSDTSYRLALLAKAQRPSWRRRLWAWVRGLAWRN